MSQKTLETRLDSLEAQVKTLQEEVKEKDKQIQLLNDIDAIKKLQCAYGYYLEHWMSQEIVDLFSRREDVSGTFVEGTYKGQEGIRRYFRPGRKTPPEFLHQVMQVSPIITVDPVEEKAWGRWYGYGTICARPANDNIDPIYMSVIYEMEYVKEDGVWKILKLAFQMHYAYAPPKYPPAPPATPADSDAEDRPKLSPDEFAEFDTQYPSGYIYPFHFKHPVTGKATSEAEYNAGLKLKPNRFRPKE